MEPLIPERLAQPFPGSYWAGRQPEDSGKLVTLLVPAQIRNFHHDTYANNCGTWWLAIEDREIWLAIAASALAE